MEERQKIESFREVWKSHGEDEVALTRFKNRILLTLEGISISPANNPEESTGK